jgi:hypothetical protein
VGVLFGCTQENGPQLDPLRVEVDVGDGPAIELLTNLPDELEVAPGLGDSHKRCLQMLFGFGLLEDAQGAPL